MWIVELTFSAAERLSVDDPLQPFTREETGRWHAASVDGEVFSALPHGITYLLGVAEIGAREASRSSILPAAGCRKNIRNMRFSPSTRPSSRITQ